MQFRWICASCPSRKSRFKERERGPEFSFHRMALCALGDLVDSVTAGIRIPEVGNSTCLPDRAARARAAPIRMQSFDLNLSLSFFSF